MNYSTLLASLVSGGLVFCNTSPMLAQSISASASPQGNGELEIFTHAPAETSAALGATRVEMLSLDIAASCDSDIRIDDIEIKHTGLGATSDIDGVYLSDDLRRLSRSIHFARDGTAHVRPQRLTIAKCNAVRVSILANISPSASPAAEHGVTIVSADRIHSTASTVTLTQSDDGIVVRASPQQAGAISVNFLSVAGPLRYGRQETVARIQLSADAKSDHLLKKIALTNTEQARDMQLINFLIETRDGTQLTPLAHRMFGKKVTLLFDPTFILRRSQTIVLLVKAEMRASAQTKVRFTLEEDSDLDAKEYRSRQ